MTTIHAVIGLKMSDDGFDRLLALEQASLFFGQSFGFASMLDAHGGVMKHRSDTLTQRIHPTQRELEYLQNVHQT